VSGLPSVLFGGGGLLVSKPHLRLLEESLASKGWRVVAVHPGNDYDISATWEIQRSTSEPSLLIDFEGMDDMVCLPLEECYGCHIRGRREPSLYFRRVNKSRQRWEQELAEFVRSLDNAGGVEPGTAGDRPRG
jgi:hypothetical protein